MSDQPTVSSGAPAWILPAFAALLLGGVTWACLRFVHNEWLPAPLPLLHYSCPGSPLTVDYRHGSDKVKLQTEKGSVTAVLSYDSINWDDYDEAQRSLGTVLPMEIKYGGAKSLQLSGPGFPGVNCLAQ